MSLIAKPKAPETRAAPVGSTAAGAPAGADSTSSLTPPATPSARAAVTLFGVTFTTAMSEDDLAVLARVLDLSTNVRSKKLPREGDLGFARLDRSSGLFLKRTAVEGQWILEAQTWGHPAPRTVHGWHVLAAGAAHQLDQTVSFPARLHDSGPELPGRLVGRASNRRLSRLRRRLVGIS
jgi:hypothetical protein